MRSFTIAFVRASIVSADHVVAVASVHVFTHVNVVGSPLIRFGTYARCV
jgi:hypothetical protein